MANVTSVSVGAEALSPCTLRLALGTVQFGQHYGIANTTGQVSADAAAAILRFARRAGIDTLDTAIAYGTSEQCLGDVGVATWQVISKLPALPADAGDIPGWVERQVRGSLQRLRIPRLEALLLHRPADLQGPRGAQLLRALAALKSTGMIAAAGVSIYDPGELDALWPVWRPDILQAPCSVLDRRLVHSGWLARLRREGIRVHIRSVFLQGLLLLPAHLRPACFARWAEILDRWLHWCAAHEVAPLRAALGYACRLPGVERVVVGVDSIEQLRGIIEAASQPAPEPPEDLQGNDRDLLEPGRWAAA